jgi:hypothetical protein
VRFEVFGVIFLLSFQVVLLFDFLSVCSCHILFLETIISNVCNYLSEPWNVPCISRHFRLLFTIYVTLQAP